VRRAYHLAEGDAPDVQGFIDLFAEEGVLNGIDGVSGQESYRGEQLGDVVVWMGKLFPRRSPGAAPGQRARGRRRDRGVDQGHLPRAVRDARRRDPADRAKLDIPTADFWYVRDGKIQEFNCHIGMTTFFAQLGVLPDFASAVAASAPER
jgi:hypothetical protein